MLAWAWSSWASSQWSREIVWFSSGCPGMKSASAAGARGPAGPPSAGVRLPARFGGAVKDDLDDPTCHVNVKE
jgi:hypothetical protein